MSLENKVHEFKDRPQRIKLFIESRKVQKGVAERQLISLGTQGQLEFFRGTFVSLCDNPLSYINVTDCASLFELAARKFRTIFVFHVMCYFQD